MTTAPTLTESYAECRRLHRAHGTTYYWATKALPAVKQPHVHALYGLCRYADEIVDEFGDASVDDRRRRLDLVETELLRGIAEGGSDHLVLKAVVFTARAFAMDVGAFVRFFDSMRADLDVATYPTYDDLLQYMDGSAAVIGELMLPILEPAYPAAALPGARDLGLAFQLTNFMRDVNEDLDRGRVYFPADELSEFGVSIRDRQVSPEWKNFCRFQIDRMRTLYASADDGIAHLPDESRPSIRAARVLYSEILDKIEGNDYDVFQGRLRVGLGRKVYVGLREMTRRDRNGGGTALADSGADRLGSAVVNSARVDQATSPGDDHDVVVVVDSDDREVGQAAKLDVHLSPGIRHRAFSLMVRGEGGWLVQQRASTKYHFAGLWSNTCCSHPRPGEDITAAARRRLFEELGMQASAFDTVGRFEYVAADPTSGFVEHEVVHVVVAEAASEPRPSAEEVDGVRWIEAAELLDEIAQRPSLFTPWLPGVLELAFEIERPTAADGAR